MEDDAPLSGRLAQSPRGLCRRRLNVATSRCLSTFGFSEALCSSVTAHSRSAGRRRDRRRLANAPAASLLLSASLFSLVAASQQTKGRCAARSQTSVRLHGSQRDVWRTRRLAAKQLAQKEGRGGTLLLRDLSSRVNFHTVRTRLRRSYKQTYF